ncbi:RNA polymerase Rpb1, domain 2, partial [Ostertagia ostertagi]
MKTVMETWDHLQPFRGLYQRLKGKHGRFPRGIYQENVWTTPPGRCPGVRGPHIHILMAPFRPHWLEGVVISPDPNLRIDEVGVPLEVALTLTYPEIVNEYNITRMKKLIISGPDTHPGANYVVDHVSG